MKKTVLLLSILLAGICLPIHAQNVAVKTNLLSDALLNINAGVEVGLAPKWTMDLSGQYNGWNLSNDRKWKHWAAQPEVRYWFCDRFAGHFLGLHAHGGQYNVGGIDANFSLLGTDYSNLSDSRYQGWFVGGGLGYGYSWVLNRHWNIEGEIGVGYSYVTYDKFNCAGCGKKTESDQTHHYVGVTKAAINLIYVF